MSLERLYVTVILLDHVHAGAHVDRQGVDADPAVEESEGPCGQRSALPILIGFRIAAKSRNGTLMVKTGNHLGNAG